MEKYLSQKFKVNFFIFLLLAGFLVYFSSLQIGFLSDDWGYAYLARHTGVAESLKFFIAPDPDGAGKGNFRPLASILTVMIWLPFLNWPAMIHGLAILFHATVAFLVSYLFWLLFKNKPGSIFAGLLFLFYPLNVETVVWLCANNAIFALLPLMAALIIYAGNNQKRSLAAAGGLVLISLLAKEYGLLFVFWTIIIDLILSRKIRPKNILVFLAIDLLYLGWRLAVLGQIGGYHTGGQWTHLLINYHGLLTYLKLPLFYLYNFFSQAAIPWPLAILSRLVLSGCLLAYLFSWAKAPDKKAQLKIMALLGLAVYAGNLLGWNLVDPDNQFSLHSRILYFSNAGFALLFAYLFFQTPGKIKKLPFIAFLGVLAVLTFFQIQPWAQAGQTTREINKSLQQIPLEKFTAGLSVENLPDSFQGAFIYRNGLEYSAALISGQPKEKIKIYKTTQAGIEKEIIIK
jgi:hypothetical protein